MTAYLYSPKKSINKNLPKNFIFWFHDITVCVHFHIVLTGFYTFIWEWMLCIDWRSTLFEYWTNYITLKLTKMPHECILKCVNLCKSTDNNIDSEWESLQIKSKNWPGLDKFGDLYSNIPWKDGPTCSKLVIFQNHRQKSLQNSNSDKRNKVTMLSVPVNISVWYSKC